MAATFAEPEGARLWFPCKDRPSDKALFETFVTVPDGLVVTSNGTLVETSAADGSRTFHWLESHPIATYLISVAIADYAMLTDDAGGIPLAHYVYRGMEGAAAIDFARTPDMIRVFQQYLGPYPFAKYGHSLFDNFRGAMEHQGNTSYGASLITGDNRYDRVVAHELGHQWFGDLVSPAEWEEIWLNEGFATWTEFLWTEAFDPAFLPALMAGREDYWMDYEESAGRYSLYAPPDGYLFGSTVYQKGGWVVAMLRYQLGDEAFFAGIRDYLGAHAYDNARTADLKAALENASGQDLTPFFDQWVYGVGYPKYKVSWKSRGVGSGRYQVDLKIKQTQKGTPIFTIPLEVEVTGDGTSSRQRVAVTAKKSFASVCVDFEPKRVTVDPDNRVLGTVSATARNVPEQPISCP
jgi:aminopeptidase N